MYLIKIILLITILINCFINIFAKPDEYLDEVQNRCAKTKRIFVCAKYRTLKYITSFDTNFYGEKNYASSALVKLIKISEPVNNITLFPNARQFAGDLEVTKMFKFCQRQIGNFVNNFGIAVSLPEGVRLIDTFNEIGAGRGSSGIAGGVGGGGGGGKKSDMLIPLLILFKLFKIKVLVAIVLVGVVFIKKTILLAALVLPTVVQAIKGACKASYHVVPHGISDDIYHDTHHHEQAVGGYGYGKEWDRNFNGGYMNKRYYVTL